jgi:riboflavin kinase/FMN adenylyltransferase
VETMPNVQMEGERVSSTRIRQALHSADHALAERLLGRPYCMLGRVVYGNQLGRQLGFPTANIYLHRQETAVRGIYVVRLYGIEEKGLPGVANVGTRPTVGGTRTLLEVHLFDFSKNIYGRQVKVEFCKKLRDEEKFSSLDLLKEQMVKDAEAARDYFRGC